MNDLTVLPLASCFSPPDINVAALSDEVLKPKAEAMAVPARYRSLVLLLAMLVLTFAGAASGAGQGLTHLHFYFHEVEAGTPNATVVNVASLHRYETLTQ
jgi:hypothetical protein